MWKFLRYSKIYVNKYNKLGSAIYNVLQITDRISAYKLKDLAEGECPSLEEEEKVLEELSLIAYQIIKIIRQERDKRSDRQRNIAS